MASDDFYGILGVSKDASVDQIKDAYHQMARKYHPDRQMGLGTEDEKLDVDFVAITKSYNTLKDADKRQKYDEDLKKKSGQPQKQTEGEKAQQTRDEMAKNAFSRGMMEMKQARFQTARELFQAAIKHDPSQPEYYSMLGIATIEAGGGFSIAEMNCEKALSMASWNAHFHLNLAKVYLKANIKTQAKKKLEDTLKWDPNLREARELLAGLDKKGSLWQKIRGK